MTCKSVSSNLNPIIQNSVTAIVVTTSTVPGRKAATTGRPAGGHAIPPPDADEKSRKDPPTCGPWPWCEEFRSIM